MSERKSNTAIEPSGPEPPGGQSLRVRKIVAPCLVARGDDHEIFVAALGDEAGYATDLETGLLRVWDRENTHLVNPAALILLRVGNVIRRR